MTSQADAKTPRAPLSRERVLRAAIQLADSAGIEALSMRRLGQELGVEAMSLYNHVANKDDLLNGIANLVLGEVEMPPHGGDWRAGMRRHAVSTHDVFVGHRWAAGLAMAPERVIPVRIEHMEWMLRHLRGAGFSEALTYHAYHAVDSQIVGFTLWELGHSVTADNLGDLVADFLRMFPAVDYPNVAEHVQQHVDGFGHGEPSAFEFVLDLVLDGLERLRDRGAETSP